MPPSPIMLPSNDSDIYDFDDHIDAAELHEWLRESPIIIPSDPSEDPTDVTLVESPPSEIQEQLRQNVEEIRADILRIDEQIAKLLKLRDLREHDLKTTESHLEMLANEGERGALQETDYETQRFDWDKRLVARMKDVFNIEKFRFCQRGVCNAVMAKRDVICIMPTGGGKSLTYQLPALLQPGCTLVISPLLALISDQVYYLLEKGIQAVRITSMIPQAERDEIFRRLYALATGKVPPGEKEIKLCYLTPEMMYRSNRFKDLVAKLNERGMLARVVIDEAHCISELGHDFRKDYKELKAIREYYPDVPILALSATCPPPVLDDVLLILKLKSVVNATDPRRTLHFSAPLYRKNLHYAILPKPTELKSAMRIMADYILQKYPDQSGIIYCLRRKEADEVAMKLSILSNGKIKTGSYHAETRDLEKERIHTEWRKGQINVVCATIAFGLGIDKPDVRFVLHYSTPKSIECFYQESGRAGRDGKDADCILFYRPQDTTSLFAITKDQKDGIKKVLDMVQFCANATDCRKLLFSHYFSVASKLDKSSWTTEEVDTSDACGHCDNCMRPPGIREDVTRDSWKIVKAASVTNRRLTLKQLATYARGLGGKAMEGNKNLREIIGSPVKFHSLATEHLINHLLVEDFLTVHLEHGGHTTTVYVVAGPKAPLLLDATRETLPKGLVTYIFPGHVKASKAPKKSVGKTTEEAVIELLSDEDDVEQIEHDLTAVYDEVGLMGYEADEDGGAVVPRESEWSFSMCDLSPRPTKRGRVRDSPESVPDSEDGRERKRRVIYILD